MSPRMLFASRRSRAAVSMASWISSSSTSASSPTVSSDTVSFAPVSRRTSTRLIRVEVARAELESQRHAAQLPLVVLGAGLHVVARIEMHAQPIRLATLPLAERRA